MLKVHIVAWGHPTLPDLDYQTDDLNDLRYKQYPMQSIAILTPISKALIEAGLKEQKDDQS